MSLQYSRRIAVCEKYIAACVAAVHLIVSSSETLLVRFMPLNRRWRGSLWASNRTCRRRGGTIQVVKTWLLQNNFAFPNRTLGGLGSMTTRTNRTDLFCQRQVNANVIFRLYSILSEWTLNIKLRHQLQCLHRREIPDALPHRRTPFLSPAVAFH